jgi:hypothetical protein
MFNSLLEYLKRDWFGFVVILILIGGAWFYLRRPATEVTLPSRAENLDMVTLLPRDGIPAIDNPQFLSAAETDSEYAPDELVIGVSINGDSRAYSTGKLSRHEIVNDTVGGRPIAVTW